MRQTRNLRQGLMQRNFGACCGILLGCIALTAGPAWADVITATGDPIADQWTLQGDSLAPELLSGKPPLGISRRLSAAITLTAGNPLVNGTTWCVGDQVLGMGGVMDGPQPILPRLVAKFGTTAATFDPSSTAAPYLRLPRTTTTTRCTATASVVCQGPATAASW